MLKPLVWALLLAGLSPSLVAQDVLVTYVNWANVPNRMDVVNRTTGAVISSQTLTLAGFTVDGTNGLAIDPTTGTTWVVLSTSGGRRLCTVDRATGVCTQIGLLSDLVASIAFSANGTLYGVTGDGANTPETLYTINKTTAAMTFFKTLGAGADGEAIGYNPVDGMMYHLSGITVAYEKIDLTTLAATTIVHTIANAEYGAMGYDPVTASFFCGNTNGALVRITPTGTTTAVGNPSNGAIKGVAIIPPPSPSIQSSTLNLNLGNTIAGTASTAVSFTVGGTNLTGDITITSPAPVVVSITGPTGGMGSSHSLTPTAGTVATTTIYVRMQASAPVGPVSVNIAITSPGATTVNVAASGQVDPPPFPEMDVLRGAIPIADGGNDALGVQVAGGTLTATYTIQNTTATVLNLSGTPRVAVTAGANLSSLAVQTQPAATVAGSGSVNFTIEYTVTTTGAFDFTVSIDNDDQDENPYNWTASGTGQGEPEIEVSNGVGPVTDGGAEAAGNRLVGTSFLLGYDVTNTGTDVLNMTTPITIANTVNCNVVVTQQPGSPVAMAAGTQLQLSITPTLVGAFSFEVIIDNDDANENPYDWTVSGTGFGVPEISVAVGGVGLPDGSTDLLGSNPSGQPITRTYDISNVGTEVLNITVPVVIGGLTNCTVSVTTQPSATVAAAGSTQLVLSITPSAGGAFSFDVSFVNDDSNESPYNWSGSGTATSVGGGGGGGGGGDGGCASVASGAAGYWFALAGFTSLFAARRRRSS